MAMLRLLVLMPLLALSLLTDAAAPSPGSFGYPSCASKCIVAAVDQGTCDVGNQTCFCTSTEFQGQVTGCVTAGCALPDILITLNTTQTACGIPTRDRGQEIRTLASTMLSVAGLFVIVRFAYKHFARLRLGWDDWSALGALIVLIAFVGITNTGIVDNGIGSDIWTLTPAQISSFSFYFYVSICLYFTVTALIKHSLILFYLNIFPSQSVQRLLKATAVFNLCHLLTFILVDIFQCTPVEFTWRQYTGSRGGECINANAASWAQSAMAIALDFWMLAIPLWQLRHLQLHWKKKIGIAIMFVLGTFMTIVSILRLRSIVMYATSLNATWDSFEIVRWSLIEVNVGMICICLPTSRLLLVRLFPRLSGSSYQKSYHRENQSSANNRFTSPLGRTHGFSTVTLNRLPSENGTDPGSRGILHQKSFAVHEGDNDETSLVVHEMSDLTNLGKV